MAKTKKEKDAEFTYQAMPAFVKYHNSLNIKTWITNFERKSDSYGLDHGWKVLHLSDYLQDEALTYYFESLCNIEDWSKLKESLIIRFQKVKLTPLVEMMRITQEEQETVTQYFHRKMQLTNNVELNLTSIVELLNEGLKTKYKPYLATIDAVQPSEWLTMAIKVENSLTGSGTPVEKGRLQTLNPALHPSPRPAGCYGNSQVQRPPMPCRICERLGLELQWHHHSVCPYRSPTASRSFSSASPHSYQAAASSSFPPPTPHDYQPTVPSASSPDSPRFLYYGIQPQYIEHDTETHTPIEKARKLTIERTIKSHEHSKQLYDIKHPEPIFKEGDQMFVKRKLKLYRECFFYKNRNLFSNRNSVISNFEDEDLCDGTGISANIYSFMMVSNTSKRDMDTGEYFSAD
ncbi:hypothetical protein LAZ67_6002788 [Cordylochernes scorpioides]|uniref:Retrotransposon gag domain-containing protein n=1 Tax=Cordylochernes scorpioides TaxID=51811 RepID=A0ABY6KK20_9ARAC|nr:hypothetical protein LAZ67_6002788 [Cordylochernes scorpioides]